MANEKRLIDANGLTAQLEERQAFLVKEWGYRDHYTRGFEEAVDKVKDAPTVDAVEVAHGEWIMVIDENDCECIECPLCGEQFYDGDNDTFDKPYNYCPNCGAKMDGDGDG